MDTSPHPSSDTIDPNDQTLHFAPQKSYAPVAGYVAQECIGGGGFSKVFRAYLYPSPAQPQGLVAALKIVSPPPGSSTPQNFAELKKEVQVHKVLRHQYILEFLDARTVNPGEGGEEEGQWREWWPGLYMLLELAAGGDLFDKIAPDVGVNDELAKIYMSQLISGLEFIHSKGICHRDLKPENLLLAADGDIRISDFGLCAVFRHKGQERLLSGRCGSLPYVAPELNGSGGYSAEPVDMWGAGVVLFTLLAGNTPWDEPSEMSPEFKAYLTGELLEYPPWNRITGQARSLLLGLLTVDPKKRLKIEQVKSHLWFLRPSQLNRMERAEMLTRGLRENGMMDVAEPSVMSYGNARRRDASQMEQAGYSQMTQASQMRSQMDSQFMRGTGLSSTSGGTHIIHSTLTRLHVAKPPPETLDILSHVFHQLSRHPEERKRVNVAQLDQVTFTVALLDKRGQELKGDVKLSVDVQYEESTLVECVRSKGDPVQWRRFFWDLTRHAGLRDYIIKG